MWIYERTYILEAGAVTGILISFTIKVGLLVSMVRVYHCFGQGLHERSKWASGVDVEGHEGVVGCEG